MMEPAVSPPSTGPIRDQHGRTFDYLRIAITDQCNLRCVYCMPEEGVDFEPHEGLLTKDEILRVVRVAASLGVTKIRYTGGEPLVRKDVVELVSGTRATPGIETIHMTTNGVLLSRHATALRAAGLDGLNVSLDTLDPEKFAAITRRTGAERVLASIRDAVDAGFPSVKVNVVAMRGFNDGEIGDFAELTRDLPVTVRFIELMPFDARQVWKTGRYLGTDRLLEALYRAQPAMEKTSGSSTEHHVFRVPGFAGKIAVIPAYSRTLCAACNRIRLTADGNIRNCLYSTREIDVREILRTGGEDAAIAAAFRRAMWAKAVDGWAAQRETAQPSHERLSMTQIGG